MSVNVGVIGLGAMGSGMARSLRRHGSSVRVFDVRSEVAQTFAAEGGVACDTLAELGAQCEVIVSVVVNAAQTSSSEAGMSASKISAFTGADALVTFTGPCANASDPAAKRKTQEESFIVDRSFKKLG